MAGTKKDPGPTASRVAATLKRIRRGNNVTAAEVSKRLAGLGQPIPDTGITKTEQGTRRVDVDDLVAISLALGVTPNTLLLPQVDYLGAADSHLITPVAGGSAERLWQWAQGERPLRFPVPDSDSWLGDGKHPALDFSIRTRPYLTALHPPGRGTGPGPGGEYPELRELAKAVLRAHTAGATGDEIRRVTELAITFPAMMTPEEAVQLLAGPQAGNGGGKVQ